MKRVLFILAFLACGSISTIKAQSILETFDTNSLEWTECPYNNSEGNSIIDKGVMTVSSKAETKWNGYGSFKEIHDFMTTCYAPLNVMKSFTIRTHVSIKALDNDKLCGLIFNYKDNGTFYAFIFNETSIQFIRRVDGDFVGSIIQGMKWPKKRKLDQEWELKSDGELLTFSVDGVQVLKVRYMPLEYTGVGFWVCGKQEIKVDDIEFIQ